MDREKLNNEKALLIKKRNQAYDAYGGVRWKHEQKSIDKRIAKIGLRITEIDVELARDQ